MPFFYARFSLIFQWIFLKFFRSRQESNSHFSIFQGGSQRSALFSVKTEGALAQNLIQKLGRRFVGLVNQQTGALFDLSAGAKCSGLFFYQGRKQDEIWIDKTQLSAVCSRSRSGKSGSAGLPTQQAVQGLYPRPPWFYLLASRRNLSQDWHGENWEEKRKT